MKRINLLIILITVASLLAACGDSEKEVTRVVQETVIETVMETVVVEGTPQVVEVEVVVTATPEPIAVSQPKYGGTLRLSSSLAPLDIDPHKVMTADADIILMNVYSTLAKIDSDGSVVGDLAQSWDVSDDGLTYTFYLHKGVKFHDVEPVNGRELTAEDVVYSIERVKTDDPTFALASVYGRVAGAEALDSYTVAITFSAPWAGFLTQIAGERPIYVVPKETVDESNDLLPDAIIGSGPFMLDWYERDLGFGLVKNPDYFVEGLPYLDGVEVRVMPEPAAADAAFLAKDIDMQWVSIPTYQQWKQQYPDVYFVPDLDGYGPPVIVLNGNFPPFNDVRVRKAISLIIDRRKVLNVYGFGEGVLAGPIPAYAKYWALPQDELLQIPGYRKDRAADIAEAKRLLEEAGYPDGEGLEQYALKAASDHEAAWQLANVVQARLKEDLGVEFEIVGQDWGAFLTDLIASNFEMGVLVTDVPADPDDILYRFFHPDVMGPIVGVTRETEPELVALIEEQGQETDPAKRQELVWEAQRIIIDKAYYVHLVDRAQYVAYWDHVQGVKTYPIRAEYHWATVWLDK